MADQYWTYQDDWHDNGGSFYDQAYAPEHRDQISSLARFGVHDRAFEAPVTPDDYNCASQASTLPGHTGEYFNFEVPWAWEQASQGRGLPNESSHSPESVNVSPSASAKSKTKPKARPKNKYPCLAPRCPYYASRTYDLARHLDKVHNRANTQLHDCEDPHCTRKGENGFTRRDKVYEHMRDVHRSEQYAKRAASDRRNSNHHHQYSPGY